MTIFLTLIAVASTINALPPFSAAIDRYSDGLLQTIDWNHYHNYTEIANILVLINQSYPSVARVFSIGESWQNRTIYCVELTNKTSRAIKQQVLFVGYHHAREQITAELALYFVAYMVTNAGANSTIRRMLNGLEIYVILALNVDGFALFQSNDWQRKNAHPTDEDNDRRVDENPPQDLNHDGFIEQLVNYTNPSYPTYQWEGTDRDGDGKIGEDWIGGVDLNRNYDYAWSPGDSDPNSETYKGSTPFSEPETQALRDLVLSHSFHYALSYHSGAEVILYPWSYDYTKTIDDAEYISIAQQLSSITAGTPYEQSSSLYFSYGTWDDWMYGMAHVKSLTCEIFNNATYQGVSLPGPYPNTVWEGGTRYMFNPFPSGIESTLLRWLPTFFYMSYVARMTPERTKVDVNRDGSVNNLDLIIVGFALGARTGGAEWNPDIDVKTDGVINVLDLILVARYLGT